MIFEVLDCNPWASFAGNRLKKGGATFKVEAICLDKFDAKKVTGTVVDNGDGTYACSYRLIHCGKIEVGHCESEVSESGG